MIQAIGLTSAPRRHQPLAVDDLSFEAGAGQLTTLYGSSGSGKTTALGLMLQLRRGRGVALFRGRPVHLIPRPSREVGVLLGDLTGHPARTARDHVRMLAAAVGVPAERADTLLDVVGLADVAHHRIGGYSLGMRRRVGLAVALLGDPHTLVLDEPADGLSPREAAWLHGLLRGYADEGGAVLLTSKDTQETARLADRVVTIDAGRLVADQAAADFARTRTRSRVTVHTPHAERLAALLSQRSVDRAAVGEVVRESDHCLVVYGSSCATVGETAHQHGILMHQLVAEAAEAGLGRQGGSHLRDLAQRSEQSPTAGTSLPVAAAWTGRGHLQGGAHADDCAAGVGEAATGASVSSTGVVPVPRRTVTPRPRISVLPAQGPSWPLRYEMRRLRGLRASWVPLVAAVLVALAVTSVLACSGEPVSLRLLSGWPSFLPLPPAALAAGLLGAMAFGQEFRFPALPPLQRSGVRRIGLLTAKLTVTGALALLLCLATAAVTTLAVALLSDGDVPPLAAGWPDVAFSLPLLVIGCAWTGALVAGILRSTLSGLAAVAFVSLLLPLITRSLPAVLGGGFVEEPAGLAQIVSLSPWPSVADHWRSVALYLTAQPAGRVLMLSLTVLLWTWALALLRSRPR